MKKIWIGICAVLAFVLIGCGNAPENEEIETTAVETVSLKTACQEHSGILDLDGVYAEIAIHTEQIYRFTNRNEEFIAAFKAFLENHNVSKQQSVETDQEHIYVSISDESDFHSFSLYENDVISVHDRDYKEQYYFCAGIYDAFEKELGPYLEENSRYCPVAITPVRKMYEYAIFDKDNVVLESDSIVNDAPHIYYNDGIVYLWVQAGTGMHTRWAKFYDVETGKVSPVYYGQTDYFGDKVCATEPSSVAVYDMFSGEEICRFDTFEKPLDNFATYTTSAYFSKDGKQIVFNYLDTEGDFQTKVFDMP